MALEKSRTWRWQFETPVETIWPVLADTARFNEAARLPRQWIEEIPRADGSVRYLARAKLGPYTLAWDDNPANWVAGRWLEHRRDFLNGPLRSLSARLAFAADGAGSVCEYTASAVPANPLGHLMLAGGFFAQIGRTFAPLAKAAGAFAKGERETEFDCAPPKLSKGARARADALVARIERSAHGHGLARRLADYVLERQDVDVWAIRPLKLARLWGVPERHAIEVCLEAVVQGLLRLRWDLLCPRCQVGKETALTLDELPTGAHCPSCNIDYGREYTKNVELAFHPAHAVRPLEGGEYCLWGPMSTPHVKIQLTLGAGEERTEPIDLATGIYRVRTLEPGGADTVDFKGGGFSAVVATDDGVESGRPTPPGRVTLANRAGRTLTMVVEERAWMRDALTAHRATALQAFRDLFSDDVLRPGDSVEIDHVALMFTDLKGSTALYDRIGDPKAYALVREHFAILGKAIRENDGALVKTIGDAVMGAFADPADAVACAVRIQADVADYNRTSGKEPLVVKLGLHVGRCISVTLNGRLDYYGSTANMAARLEAQSQGGDIVLSQDLAADPGAKPLLARFAFQDGEANLKGFGARVPYLRITAEALAAAGPQGAPSLQP